MAQRVLAGLVNEAADEKTDGSKRHGVILACAELLLALHSLGKQVDEALLAKIRYS